MLKSYHVSFWALSTVAVMLLTGCERKVASPTYEGDIDKDVSLATNENSHSLTMSINSDKEWSIFAGRSEDSIDMSQPLVEGSGNGDYTLNIDNTTRHIFQINTTQGKTIMTERKLPLEGGHNFRDLGGIKNKDGKRVKWGKIFRSDDLHSLTDADLKYLESIPITSIVDFRSQTEIAEARDKVPQTSTRYEMSITPGNLTLLSKDVLSMTSEQAMEMMKELNDLLASDSACINQYKDFFGLLQNPEHAPLLFHCTAGKDRTGMGAALILFALNVDEETIFEDYLSSNKYLETKYQSYLEQYPQLEALFGVKREFLQTGIDRIKADHGSIENYLTNVLGVDIPKFRELYLHN